MKDKTKKVSASSKKTSKKDTEKSESTKNSARAPKKSPTSKKNDLKKPSSIEKGHKISVHYKGTLTNGEEFDNSEKNGPISFIVGNNQVIKGFDDAVLGMKVNDTKKFTIKKEDAYGDVNLSLMHKIPLDKLPENLRSQVKEGGFLVLQSPTGQQIPAKVHSIENGIIVLDLNHPLAGKDLTFDIKIMDINHADASHQDKQHCCSDECKDKDCGSDCDCK